jgi:accessory colonization factor AcfC
MKTIYEWIEICKKVQPEIGQAWEDNMLYQRKVNNLEEYPKMITALSKNAKGGNFDWITSPQGEDFWIKIYDDIIENPDKYNKIKRKLFNTI